MSGQVASGLALENMGVDPSLQAECIVDAANVLGESPVWSARNSCLYWADIESQRVYEFDATSHRHREMALDIGVTAIAPCSNGQWLAASRTGLYLLDESFSRSHFLLNVESNHSYLRFNDAVADRQGRLWAGTLNERQLDSPDGKLYRIDNQWHCEPLAEGFAVANGIAFSPDGAALYVVDMFRREIRVYDHDQATGALTNPRIFIRLCDAEGMPDGLTVDRDGGLWVCHWDGCCVSRYDETGTLVWRLMLPVSRVTRCTFGGDDLHDLYITTARFGLDDEALSREPQAGGLFRVRVPWQGLAESQFHLT